VNSSSTALEEAFRSVVCLQQVGDRLLRSHLSVVCEATHTGLGPLLPVNSIFRQSEDGTATR